MDPNGSEFTIVEEVAMDGKDDRREGRFDEAKGNVKDAFGDATGNEDLEHEGKKDRAKGKAKQALGATKDAAGKAKDVAADAVDSVRDRT
jgi:uncharacterized protein YjbJ (UPF0337 family)